MFASLHTARLAHRKVQSAGRLSRLGQAVWQAMAVSRQRRQLLALDAHTLNDIGLDRAAALAEARRPIWDVPASWRC